ncbi:unnamed protein product [Effrenium voratum]|uniref:Magnesium transporter MgtE intracellular domain-containing protein n=1 Tax=Effrenium voratum TaxID=2562239 RepID=A0AA36HS27_9DINO|nr:unnamed protein product [Effrenium voratum]CAJ1419014.1 unnamed protein product [Effrenium voratum]
MACCLPIARWRTDAANSRQDKTTVTFDAWSILCLLKDYPGLASATGFSQSVTVWRLVSRLKVLPLRHFLIVVPQKTLVPVWASLLEGLPPETLCRVLPALLNEVEVHPTLAAVMKVVEPSHMLEMLRRVPPGHLVSVCKAPSEKLCDLLSNLEHDQVHEALLPMLLEPQQIIDQGLVPVLVNTHDAKRLASIINLVDKEVLLHLLRHVDGEKLAQLVNDFEEDKDFFADGPIIRLLQEASKDYKLLQDKVAPLMQRVDAVKTVRLVSGVQPSKLLEVLRQVDCPTALILMSNANENFVVNMLCGPLDGLVSATAPGVAEVMKLNARIAAAFRAERPDQAAKLLDPVATQEMAVIAQAELR